MRRTKEGKAAIRRNPRCGGIRKTPPAWRMHDASFTRRREPRLGRGFAHAVGQLIGEPDHLLAHLAFDHDANHRLGARSAQQHAT